MIIYGWRGVTRTQDRGTFNCPTCRSQKDYAHKHVRNWFTLYFIPIIPLNRVGDYVECNGCGQAYTAEILKYDPNAGREQLVSDLHNGLLVVMAATLLADGVVDDRELVVAREHFLEVTGSDLPMDVLHQVIESVRGAKDGIFAPLAELAPLLNEHGKEMLVKAAFAIAAADGTFQDEEKELLKRIAHTLQMTPSHFNGVAQSALAAFTAKPPVRRR